jgi:glycosidase
VAFDWTDTRQLNYKNVAMQDSMINAMKYWVRATDIDGFRCDVAWNVPYAFWKKCISQLNSMKELFWLAEGDKTYLHPGGFDATYPWDMFHAMVGVAKGARPATSLDSIKARYDKVYPHNALELYFTSNHDENSWNKADYGTFPKDSHAPFAVFTQTMPHSIPLIYSGQEEPVLRAIKFFDKDNIKMGKYDREKFYKTLLFLRKQTPALSADASFRKVNVGDNKAVYAYVREKDGKKVFVILNLSNKEQNITVEDESLIGKPLNVFRHQEEPVTTKPWKMDPWGYVVFRYN